MADSARHHYRWRLAVAVLAGLWLVATLPLALPLAYLADHDISLSTLSWVSRYFASLPAHPLYWLDAYRHWLAQAIIGGRLPPSLLVSPALSIAWLVLASWGNPFRPVDESHGRARWAKDRDVRKMKLLNGLLVVLGRWRGHRLKLPETLSVLCIAPPGTGKTVSVVIPTILDGDQVSMVINDVKPELYQITAGHRQRLGPVYRLDWASADDPVRGICPPRWNPLSPLDLPPPGAARDLYIDRLSMILIADPAGGADPHWSRKARAALAGLTHFILGKTENADYQGFPDEWNGAEACFPMLLDWITEATLAAGARLEQWGQSDPGAAFAADPIRDMLTAAAQEARRGAYAHRAVQELTQLASTPDRERGSILSTMDAGLAIFKNSAVRQRCRTSDVSFADLRGRQDPASRRWQPVTLYLCVNQQDARVLGVITGLFIEALSSYLIAHPPGTAGPDERQLGPYPVLFVLDEFPQMPKLPALIDGPAVGRGQKVAFLLIGQDFAQIEDKYGKTGLETLISTTAAKIILPLNNEQVAKRFSDMVGNFTHVGLSKSRTHGFSRQANPFATNVTKSLTGLPLLQPADLMSMTAGTQILLYQGFTNCPVRLISPVYYRDRHLRHRAFDPRTGKGLPPS